MEYLYQLGLNREVEEPIGSSVPIRGSKSPAGSGGGGCI